MSEAKIENPDRSGNSSSIVEAGKNNNTVQIKYFIIKRKYYFFKNNILKWNEIFNFQNKFAKYFVVGILFLISLKIVILF